MEFSLDSATVDTLLHDDEVRELAAVCAEWSGHRGLRLHLSDDLTGWANHLRRAAGAHDGLNPTFDPQCHLAIGEGMHLLVRDESREVVACTAGRLFRTRDFAALIRSLALWFDPLPDGMRGPLEAALPATVPLLSGRVGHVGGLWVDPRFRGTGLSMMLARLTRGVALDRFDADWDTWISFGKIARDPALRAAYGEADTTLCVDGFFPPKKRHEQVYLSYATREQVLDAVREGAATLRDSLLHNTAQRR
ncbi:hypothetical protein IL992_44500 [Microbispora sp. NEAU-D428]|uniref:hypothetical protein n=1 Tax=Microbispora sitophila TaxID=2771537 RepID=UPI001867F39A|nr:hypothetical protein [Microbispora sitophila]MBE3016161.1 hypothetical protein [Microbispora sitophila]